MVGMFTSVSYLWYEADMDVAEVLPLHLELELSEGLNEGHTLYVPHCASQLLTQNTSSDYRTACMNTQTGFSVPYVTLTKPYRVQNAVSCTEPIILPELLLMCAKRKNCCRQGNNLTLFMRIATFAEQNH